MCNVAAIVPIKFAEDRSVRIHEWIKSAVDLNISVVVCVDQVVTNQEQDLYLDELKKHGAQILIGNFGGPGPARNVGMEITSAEWLVFWDSDDLPLPPAFVDVITEAQKHNALFAVSEYTTEPSVDNSGASELTTSSYDPLWESALNPGIWRWAFRRDRIGGNKFPAILMAEDQLFLARLRPLENEIYFSETCTYKYFRDGVNQLTKMSSALNQIKIAAKEFETMDRDTSFVEILYSKVLLSAFKFGNSKAKVVSTYKITKQFFRLLIVKPEGKKILRLLKINLTNSYHHSPRGRVVLAGGLGNQLFQYAFGLHVWPNKSFTLYSGIGAPSVDEGINPIITKFHLSDRVTVEKPQSVSFIAKRIFNLSLRYSSRELPSGQKNLLNGLALKTLQCALAKTHFKKTQVRIARGVGFDSGLTSSLSHSTPATYIGYFQSYKYISENVFRELGQGLSLKRISSSLNEFIGFARQEAPLIVHVRLGDYANEKLFGIPSPKYFEIAMEKLWKTNEYKTIWLFSNQIDDAFRMMPGWASPLIRKIGSEQFDTAETLELMRHGKGYVISNSTFSWWAATLTYTSNAIVVAP